MDNEIVGAIYVGQVMLNAQVKDFISKTKIGPGYFFVYEDKGKMLLHPTLDEKTNLYELVPQFKNAQESFIRYDWHGQDKATYIKHLESWGVYLAVGLDRDDIINGLDVIMLRNNLLVGLIDIAAGILVTIFLVRSINRPLKELAEKSARVGDGDYTINFASENKDAIGQLTNSLGIMVGKSKDMLQDIITSSQALAAASQQLAAISEHMVTNASTGIMEINHNVANSSQMTTMMSENVGQVKERSIEVKENSQQIRTSADELSALSDKLTQLVAKFKIS